MIAIVPRHLVGAAFLAALLAGVSPVSSQTEPRRGAIASRPARVERVRSSPHADYTRVVVDLDAPVRYRKGELGPKQLYLDLFDTQIDAKLIQTQIQVGGALLRWIWITQPQAGVTRIGLDLNAAASLQAFVLAEPPRLVVDVRARSGDEKPANAAARPPTLSSVMGSQRAPSPASIRGVLEDAATARQEPSPAPTTSVRSRVTAVELAQRSDGQIAEQSPPSQPAASQTASGISVSGTLLDPSGAVVPGAKLTLRPAHTHQQQSATSDAAGQFRFDGVAEGHYELQVEHPGFKEYKARVKVRARPSAPLRIVLAIAELQETVTVDSSEKRASSVVGENVDVIKLDRQFLDSLPLLDQDIVATVSSLLDPASVGSGGATLVVDGMPSSVVGVPAAAIQEVRINKNPYSAEFARPGRGRIEIITKSGSSKYHGSISFGLRDYRLDARNAFAVERPPEQRRQWDGYLSGPVGKSKNTTFLLSASRKEDNLQAIVDALGPSGPILENFARPRRSRYFSAQLTHQMGKDTLSLRYSLFDWSDHGEGVGGFALPEVAADSTSRFHQMQLSYKRVISPTLLNEFSVRVRTEDSLTRSRQPGILKTVVLDAFTGGGAQADRHETDSRIELTDILFWSRGKHFVKTGVNIPALSRHGSNDRANFDGTFHFSSLQDFANGRPFSFVRDQGDSRLAFWEKEFGLFIQDDVRLLPNLSVAFGLRYDWQNYIPDRYNFAPRLAFAYAPGKGQKTVLRAGAGFFYDTTGPTAIADVLRFDGLRLRQFVLSNPGFPDPLSLGGSFSALPTSIVRFDSHLRSPYLVQYSFGVERQLLKSLALSTTYIGTQGVKMFRSRDINAPPPPLFLSRPDPSLGVLRQIESSGRLQSHAVEVGLRGSFSRFFDGLVMYKWQRAYNNTDGIGAFPANNYDLASEWSRARFDVRHSFYLYGVLNPGRFFKLGMVLSAHSGRPYSLTTGRDDNRDGFANDRPPGVPRNSLQGPGSVTLDLRWSKDFLLHRSGKDKRKEKGPSATIAVDAFNVLNHVNFGQFVGNLSSPFFGRAFSATPARHMQVSLVFKF